MTVKEISEKYNVTVDEIRKLCREGKIEGAEKTSEGWSIPEDKAEEYFVGKKEQPAAPAEPKEKIIPSGDEGKKLITGFIITLIVMIVGLGVLGLGLYLAFAEDMIFIGSICLIIGGGIAWACFSSLKDMPAKISAEIRKEKEAGVKHTKKKIMKICFGIAGFIIAAGLIAGSGYGIYEGSRISSRADRLLSEEIDEDVFDEIADFDAYYADASAFGKLFFTKQSAVDEFRAQADKLVEERAVEIKTKISQLETITEIKSTAEYNELRNLYGSLRLSDSDEFESYVKAKVDNYADFEAHEEAFEKLCKTYEVTRSCGSCGGRGRFSCSSCNGKGKKLVTWYSEGDWGEKSYSSYTCTSCNGKGKSTCSSCGGDGKYVYLDFGD